VRAVVRHALFFRAFYLLDREVGMSSVKGLASAIITMHKLGKSVDEIQAMLDASEYRQAKQEVLSMVSTYINSITQQQLKEKLHGV
jgi:hypothetical protein